MSVSKSKASDYLTAGIILLVLAGVIWLVENLVLNKKVDNIIQLVIPSIFVLLSVAHLVVAGSKWYSSR
jgi:hypothetical protein